VEFEPSLSENENGGQKVKMYTRDVHVERKERKVRSSSNLFARQK